MNLLITLFCSRQSEFPVFLTYVPVSVMSFWIWTGRKGLLRSILDFGILLAWLEISMLLALGLVFRMNGFSAELSSSHFGPSAIFFALFLLLSVWPMRFLSRLVGAELRHFDCSGPVSLSDVFFVTALISGLLGGMLWAKDFFAQQPKWATDFFLPPRSAVYDEGIQIVWPSVFLFPLIVGVLSPIVYVPICRIVNVLFLSETKCLLRLFVGLHSLSGIAAFLTIRAWDFSSGYEGIAGIILAEAMIFLSIVALNSVVRRLAKDATQTDHLGIHG